MGKAINSSKFETSLTILGEGLRKSGSHPGTFLAVTTLVKFFLSTETHPLSQIIATLISVSAATWVKFTGDTFPISLVAGFFGAAE
jgi:hypothetical protein